MKNAAKPSIRTTSTSSTTHYNSNSNSNSNSSSNNNNSTIQDTKIKIKIKSALAPNIWSLPGTKPRDPNHNHQSSELPLLLSESEYYSDRPRSILQGGEGEADAAAAAAAAAANESEERPGHYSDDRDDCNNFEEEEESSLAGEWTLSLPLPLPLPLSLSSRIYWVPTFRNGGASGVEVVGDYDDDDDDDNDCRRRASGAVSDRQPAASKRMKVLEKSLDLPYFWW